jgi:flagellin
MDYVSRLMLSLRTNVDSLNAQTNLKVNSSFQSKTIQQLTSGYRINQSGDDAAGLAVANALRSGITELTQGVANGNDGLGQLQIIDGGLSNISNLLDRMRTLATQSASDAFTGDRATLNQEYQQLVKEVTRQATNINLNLGGSLNKLLNVYLGGANSTADASVAVDLSGPQSAVDASSLGLNSNVLMGGAGFSAALSNRLDAPGAKFVIGGTQNFGIHVYENGANVNIPVTIGSPSGMDLDTVLATFNSALAGSGITAGVSSNGTLELTGSVAFTAVAGGGFGSNMILSGPGTLTNTANYTVTGCAIYSPAPGGETLTFQNGSGSASVSLTASETRASAASKINAATASLGIYAVYDPTGSGLSFQSVKPFSASTDATTANHTFTATGLQVTTPGVIQNNAADAIDAIDKAVQSLGLVQGRVGAGENKLQYAINLAQSQIASFSAAESQIRDADIAFQAANLTKAQVLQQTSIAAMAQANQIPQTVLKLIQ